MAQTSKQRSTTVDGTQQSANRRRLAAAHQHLDLWFSMAENGGLCIDGRKFWGTITLTIPFQDGEAGDVIPTFTARDRVHS